MLQGLKKKKEKSVGGGKEHGTIWPGKIFCNYLQNQLRICKENNSIHNQLLT